MNGLNERNHPLTATPGFFFARFIAEQAGQTTTGVLARTAAWLSDIQANGDVCLNLELHAECPWPDQSGDTPALPLWRKILLDSICVEIPGERAPMTLDGNRLYLNRFWHYEDSVARSLRDRLSIPVTVDKKVLAAGLLRLFGKSEEGVVNWQKVAAALALIRCFTVISGGPGTGKTTSLVNVLVLLLEQQPRMQIRMAAPTGKAAARMMESIRTAKAEVKTDEETRSCIPDQASTLHRLLGYSSRGYRHDRSNPLMLDCLVIDEASMLDLPMMARLLEALPDSARLILLGDRDQLASVDAGNVLGDITGHGHDIAYTPETVNELAELTGVDENLLPVDKYAPSVANAIALLRTSYRFKADSGIGRLAHAINKGESDAVLKIFTDSSNSELTWLSDEPMDTLLANIVDAYIPYLQAENVEQAMHAFEKLRVLCAVRKGSAGVETINQSIARRLINRGQLTMGDAVHGMPVMVTSNNYELGLFNGDIGLLWSNAEGNLRAWFRQPDNTLREIPVQSLPQHELAWAMTVHKSQGSEFERVILVLPEEGKGDFALTRELLYTAITRAKQLFTLYGKADVVKCAALHTVNRSTGLASRLQWPEE